jgi:serine/threonine protein kinase
MTEPILNEVKNRFLPIPESVAKCLEPETKINDFEIIKELGSGAFGNVYLVVHKKTKAQYAIKAIDKRNKSNIDEKPYFRREVEIMYKVNHPNIVKLYGHFEDNNYCYFLMEYISKGNLYGLIPKDSKKRINTRVVASIMKDLISAIYYLHNMNPPIIHRDIKPENILLNDGLIAKIADFGWSNYIVGGIKRTTMCGTPVYLPPEIIKEKGHDERVDIWCIGVLLFELTTGSLPFKGPDLETLKNNILNLKISWPKDINLEAKNLIIKILKIEPEARLSLVEIIQHSFFTKYFKDPLQFLVKPDLSKEQNTFIISKDNPKTWNYNSNINNVKESTSNINIHETEDNLSEEKKYMELLDKYEKLKNDYDSIKNGGAPTNEIEELNNILHEKEERVAELLAIIRKDSGEKDETYLKIKCDELEIKNIYYKEKMARYEQFIKNHKIEEGDIHIEKKLKGLRNSMDENNKLIFDKEVSDLKKHLDFETEVNLNEIINEKDREIEKIKEEAKVRREKEKKKYSSIADKYDKQLTLLEKENEELKVRLKQLQG